MTGASVIIAIVAVLVALLIAIPVTANVAVKKKNRKGCRNHWDSRGQSKEHNR